MKRTKKTARNWPYSRIIALWFAAAIHAPVLEAAPWEFGADIQAQIIYTDNLRLADEGNEEDDFVYRLVPTFTLTNESDRLTADIRYRPDVLFYSDLENSDQVYHSVDSTLTWEVARDAIFLDLTGQRFQTIVVPEGSIPTSNIPISENRTDSTVWQVRPYWRQNLGFAEILLDLGYAETTFDDDEGSVFSGFVENSTEERASLDLNNIAQGSGIAWALRYDYRNLEYDDAIPFEYQIASVNIGYWFDGTFRIFVEGGLETPYDDVFDSSLEDEFWEVGFQYQPNQRLNVELATGQRSFGSSYRADISYELRRGQTTILYSNEPVSRGELFLERSAITSSDSLDSFLDRPTATDRFVRQRGEWTTSLDFSKSTASLRLFYENRDQRTTDIGAFLDSEEFSGVAFRWAWELGARSTLAVETDFTTRNSAAFEDDLTRYAIDYQYRISQRYSIGVRGQHSMQDNENSFFNRYEENQIRLSLRAEY